MSTIDSINLTSDILKKAKEFGATLGGIANVDDLRKAPSFTVAPKMPEYNGVGAREEKIHAKSSGEVDWPKNVQSIIVIAYAHPPYQPELDYWYGRSNPIGNKKLITIINNLKEWLQDTYKIESVELPYHIEKGGIYLKDAAVLAGMGCIGKNNLLVTPSYGPHVRLRALAINPKLSSCGPITFYPCAQCEEYCRKDCPQQAFNQKIYTIEKFGEENLPGRTGHYNRLACNIQMKLDEESAETQITEHHQQPVKVVKYCRNCEYACPIGK